MRSAPVLPDTLTESGVPSPALAVARTKNFRGGELMQEGSRGLRRQVRVVDPDHEAVSSGTARERVSELAQKL